MRENVKTRRFRTAVESLNANADVFRAGLGILDKYVEIAILIEDASIQKLKLRALALAILGNQLSVRELRLRILVQHSHVAVGGSVIQIKPVLLDVLSVISFGG